MIGERDSEIWSRMKPALRRDRRARLALASALITTALVLSGCGQRTRVAITIAGTHEQVSAGTTLAEAVALFRLRPAAGSLLDVQGRVLRTPGVEVIVRGAFSHELVSVRFRPNGHQPTLE